MLIREISDMPVTINASEYECDIHESVCRSYHVVRKVRDLLIKGTPGKVVIELIDEMGSLQPILESPCVICDPDAEKAIASLDKEE